MAGLVGSEIRGPNDLSNLHSKDFKINFVENTQAQSCANAVLEKDSITAFDNEQRRSLVEYQLATRTEVTANNGEQNEIKVKALKIQNNMASSCEIETIVEWFDPMQGEWEDIRSSEYSFLTKHMAQNELYVSFKLSQEEYMNIVSQKFSQRMNTRDVPAETIVMIRFVHFNPASNKEPIIDTVELKIKGTTESKLDFCDLSVLNIDQESRMVAKHFYQVGTNQEDGWEKRIFVSTQLSGAE
jgi:hypothetical protein